MLLFASRGWKILFPLIHLRKVCKHSLNAIWSSSYSSTFNTEATASGSNIIESEAAELSQKSFLELRNKKRRRLFYGTLSKMMMQFFPSNRLLVSIEKSTIDVEDHEHILISLKLHIDGFYPRILNLRRPSEELFVSTVECLKQKIIAPNKKKRSHKFRENTLKDESQLFVEEYSTTYHEIKVILIGQTSDVEDFGGISNHEVFFSGRYDRLRIGDSEFQFVHNTKDISVIKLIHPLVGCPMMANVTIRNIDESSKSSFECHWFVSNELPDELALPKIVLDRYNNGYHVAGWTLKATAAQYCPSYSDVGKRVLVVCDPGPNTIARAVISQVPVYELKPEPLLWEERQAKYCATLLTGNRYRMMSYNVLANAYLRLKNQNQQDLYYPYCPKEYQEKAYRYPLLLREIPGYRADIACLQEVDTSLYDLLRRSLKLENYEIIYREKNRHDKGMGEGLATVFRKDRFRLMRSQDQVLADLLDPDVHPENEDLCRNTNVDRDRLLSLPTFIQTTCLMDMKIGCVFVVGNVHLPALTADEQIRTLQTVLCLRHLHTVEIGLQGTCTNVAVMFAGDFNSEPQSNAIRLLTHGHLTPANLHVDVKLKNATGYPQYTNYCMHEENGQLAGFRGCLDYIWLSNRFTSSKAIPLPDASLVTKYTAIPSAIAPSDHLPVITECSFV